MEFNITPPCTNCGERKIINPIADMPAMVGFQLEDGTIINICSDCLTKLGQMNDEEKENFFERLGK